VKDTTYTLFSTGKLVCLVVPACLNRSDSSEGRGREEVNGNFIVVIRMGWPGHSVEHFQGAFPWCSSRMCL